MNERTYRKMILRLENRSEKELEELERIVSPMAKEAGMLSDVKKSKRRKHVIKVVVISNVNLAKGDKIQTFEKLCNKIEATLNFERVSVEYF